MKLPMPNAGFDVFGVDGAKELEVGLLFMMKSLSLGRFAVGSSLIPANLLICARASGPIFLH